MEIPRDRSTLFRFVSKAGVAAVVTALIIVVIMMWQILTDSTTETKNIATDIVRLDSLKSTILAYGVLKPVKITSMFATVEGRVRQVLAKPGSKLNKGEAIIEMVNPKLYRISEEIELGLLERKSDHEILKARLDQEYLALNSENKMAAAQLELSQIDVKAKQILVNKKIISVLQFKKSQLVLKQTLLKKELAQGKLDAFERSKLAELKASNFRLEKANKQLAISKHNIAQLTIRADMAGILNDLNDNIQPGETILEGQVLGQIADLTNLYAELKVTAADASSVLVEQLVKINIKGQFLSGKVSRISPNVENNQVRIDVTLQGSLPSTARSNIEVTANITVAAFEPKLIVKRSNIVTESNQTYQLFVKPAGQESYYLTEIEVGELTSKQMQILNGAKLGDKILLSVPKRLKNSNKITLEQVDV